MTQTLKEHHMRFTLSRSALGAAAAIVTSLIFAGAAAGPATAATTPRSDPRITAPFDLAAGQTPENIVVEPNGSTDVTLVGSRQVAHVDVHGKTTILATMPLPADGGVNTPITGAALPTGIARTADGTLFIAYAAGESRSTGLWQIRPGGKPHRIAALPATSFPNGIALDEAAKNIYIADSALGTVWKVPLDGGTARAWATDPALNRTSFAGANGLKVHRGAVWVTNTDAGTLLRIPITSRGSAGGVQVRATDLTNVDDFDFTGRGDQVLAALFGSSEVVLVGDAGEHRVVLNSSDGLQNPTAVAVLNASVTVASSARQTGTDPNLLTARLFSDR